MTMLHRLDSGSPPVDEALLTQQTAEPQLSVTDRPAKRSRLDLSSQVKDAPQQRDWREGAHVMEYNDVSGEVSDATQRGDWRKVGHLMEHGQLSTHHRSEVVEAAGQRAEEQDLTAFILPFLTEGELHRVLDMLFTRRLWPAVGKMLRQNISNTLSTQILFKALCLDRSILSTHILSSCMGSQLDLFMTHLVTTDQWHFVTDLLDIVSDGGATWQVGDIHMDSRVLGLVAAGLWQNVGEMLRHGVSDSLRRWVIDVACQRAGDFDFTMHILSHCADDQLDGVLTTLVTRRLWKSVHKVLDFGVSPMKRSWAVLEACQHADDENAIQCVVDRHMYDQEDDIVTMLASQGMWKHVVRVLDLDVSPAQMIHDGMSVLHRLIRRGSWGLVKLLMSYVVEFNHHAFSTEERIGDRRSPLEILIDARQTDIIMHVFSRCLDLSRGVNTAGETTLHVACLTGSPCVLQELLGKRVDPRAVTITGHSPLSYAVMCTDRPQQTVAECIRLGFSTHQSRLTNSEQNATDGEPQHDDSHGINSEDAHSGHVQNDTNSVNTTSSDHDDIDSINSEVTNSNDTDGIDSDDSHSTTSDAHDKMMSSPTLLAVMRGLPLVTQMLYESGACSYRELFSLQRSLTNLLHADQAKAKELEEEFYNIMGHVFERAAYFPPPDGEGEDMHEDIEESDTERVQECARYLKKVSLHPRSLKSTCRLVISHCLKLHDKREEDVEQLPLEPAMKRYVMFSELTRPDYGLLDDSACKQTRDDFVRHRLSKHLSSTTN